MSVVYTVGMEVVTPNVSCAGPDLEIVSVEANVSSETVVTEVKQA